MSRVTVRDVLRTLEAVGLPTGRVGASGASLVWLEPALEEQDEVRGPDPSAYGFEPSRDTLQAVIRMTHEEGLVRAA